MPRDIEQMLQEGDVIHLGEGVVVYASLPKKFIYSNVTERRKDANALAETEVKIGEVRKTTKSAYDTGELIGDYIVLRANMDGGGEDRPNDSHPDGWHVVAKKLREDGSYNPDGKEVSFYQSGDFTAMIMPGEVKPIRKMKKTFV